MRRGEAGARPLGRARESDGRENEKVNMGVLQRPATHSRYEIRALESTNRGHPLYQ